MPVVLLNLEFPNLVAQQAHANAVATTTTIKAQTYHHQSPNLQPSKPKPTTIRAQTYQRRISLFVESVSTRPCLL